MRRKDREMGRAFGLVVIDRAPFGVLSVLEPDGQPYGLPLSIARKGDTLYFHSATGGKKTTLLPNGAPVHVVFVGEVRVPAVMAQEEAEEAAKDPARFGELTSKLFTTEFESAMVRGRVRLLTSDEEKTRGLWLISRKFTPQWMPYFPQAVESGLKHTAVYAVDIDEITAKRKKYDAAGVEMKWQRTEPGESPRPSAGPRSYETNEQTHRGDENP